MADLIVLNHDEHCGPSAFTSVLESLPPDLLWRQVEVAAGADLPEPAEQAAGVLVLGGPQSATAPEALPWMSGELDWLRRAVRSGVPTMGICLGAQLLGRALGGGVVRRPRPEVGFLPLTRTAAGRGDPVLAGWVDGSAPLLMHEDDVNPLPPGAVPLLEGADCTPAWRLGSAVALQPHPEVTAEQVGEWTRMPGLDALLAAAACDAAELIAQAQARESDLVAAGRSLFERWLRAEVLPRRDATAA